MAEEGGEVEKNKRFIGKEEKLKIDFGVYMRLGKLKPKRVHL